ncbi:S-layer homology domain-containing protein [Acutalibacter sp. 1XD8-36]|uniref:S-layer homology domain-containing protein n=1 Tax=Acutalibacter sp. 1XD8-36 TaxID=2320852 RepID=UPI0014128717|nr:S-layer homology domain-containing protein [Acutalibacter sp. 1XD8-36]
MPKTPSGENASYVRIAPTGSKPPKPTEPTVGGFSDVKQSAYYADAVLWAVENGITSGIGGGKFAPAQTCKREQIVTFLYRSKGSPQVSITDQFTDMPKSEEFQRAISWAVENNITMGNGKGQFSPEKGCTRAEAMTFIWRAAGRPEPKTEASFSDMPSSSDFRKAISWAVENNITQGIGNNKFGPNNPCNRGHIVTFLYNAKDL